MEQQYRQVPPVQPESYGKRLWHIWGPLVIKIGIAMVVSMIAAGIFMSFYFIKQYGLTPEIMQNQEKMQEFYQMVMQNPMAVAEEASKEYMKYSSLVDGLAALVTIPVMAFLFHRDRVSQKLRGIVQNKKAPFWKYAAAVLMAMTMCLGLNNLILIGNFYTVTEEYAEMVKAIYSAPVPLQIICLGILAPICEELVFRGLIFKRLREKGTFLQAAMYSSVIYALLYPDMMQMLYGIIMGMAFAYIYEKYGSVKAPILASVSASVLSVAGSGYHLFDWLLNDPIRMGVVTVLCASMAATMFVLIQRIEEQPEETV